jgi:hypothetical protein
MAAIDEHRSTTNMIAAMMRDCYGWIDDTVQAQCHLIGAYGAVVESNS